MAGRLLGVGLAAVLVHGCLLPQDDQPLPDLPAKKNTPARLLVSTAAPARQNTVLKLNPLCLPKDRPFKVAVVDPDLGDTIYSRWYVDADEKFTTLPVNGTGLDTRATSPERGTVRPIDLFYTSGALFSPPGAHQVTVVISDRAFVPEGIEVVLGELDLPDGGKTPDTTITDQYSWDVITDQTPPPTPQTPCQ